MSSRTEATQMKNKGKKRGTLTRVLKLIYGYYPKLFPLTVLFIIFTAVCSSVPALFLQSVTETIEKWTQSGDWASASGEIIPRVALLGGLYVLSIAAITAYTQMMAYMTQGFLCKLRRSMFDGMQNLPIKFFDTNKHGDIMSYYTNDIDTLRQLISQALPALLQSAVIILTVLLIMLYFSIPLTAVVLLAVGAMTLVSKKVGGGSAKFFLRAQKSIAKTEGFIQEMMNGQKVVKVFCHEEECKRDFEEINSELYNDSFRANAYANCLGPIIGNIGNVLYVLLAMTGGLFIVMGTPNFSLSGMAMGISIVVPFLNMAKQFAGNVNQASQQINSIVMGMAGAERIFELMD